MLRASRPRWSLLALSILALFFTTDRLRAQAMPEWLTRLNLYRAAATLPFLAENLTFSDSDYKHARYIVKTDTMFHGEDPASPFYTPEGAAAGANSNIAWSGSSSASEAWTIDLWMQMPFHSVEILDPRLQTTGYGIYHEADGGYQTGAALDVLRGRASTVPAGITYPIAFPGNGSTVPIGSFAIPETPNALTGCPGYTMPTGLPIVLQLGSGPVTPSVTASSFSADGVALTHCVFTETTYTNPNSSAQSTGRSILSKRDAIVLIPRAPLTSGATYDVSITTNGIVVPWSFSVNSSASCSGGVSPASTTGRSGGGAGSLAVNTVTGCGWMPSSTVGWIRSRGVAAPAVWPMLLRRTQPPPRASDRAAE